MTGTELIEELKRGLQPQGTVPVVRLHHSNYYDINDIIVAIDSIDMHVKFSRKFNVLECIGVAVLLESAGISWSNIRDE